MIRGKIIGIIFGLSAIFLPLICYEKNNYQAVLAKEQVDNYLNKTTNDTFDESINVFKEPKKINDYVAVLEIPSIKLKHGLVSKNNPYNNIKYNIQILMDSEMPDVINGNFILAAHSGSSEVSFFNNLDKLSYDSYILIYYNGYKYEYKLSNTYIVKKEGIINITRDTSKNTITLITCKNDNDIEQVVYIGYLFTKEEY